LPQSKQPWSSPAILATFDPLQATTKEEAMRASRASISALAILLAAAEPGFVGTAWADGDVCSLATLRGRYMLYGQGTAFIGTPQVGQEADIGIFTADGKGKAVGSVTFSLNGKIFRTKFTGTYLINADCTATVIIQDDFGEVLHEEGVIFPDGKEFRFIETDPGQLIARVARRLNE
jgi:hypothetical protein